MTQLHDSGERRRKGDRVDTGAAPLSVTPDSSQPLFLPQGPFVELRGRLVQHHIAQERALDKEEADVPPPRDPYQLGSDE